MAPTLVRARNQKGSKCSSAPSSTFYLSFHFKHLSSQHPVEQHNAACSPAAQRADTCTYVYKPIHRHKHTCNFKIIKKNFLRKSVFLFCFECWGAGSVRKKGQSSDSWHPHKIFGPTGNASIQTDTGDPLGPLAT